MILSRKQDATKHKSAESGEVIIVEVNKASTQG